MAPVECKHGWQIAEQVRDTTPYGMSQLFGRVAWAADAGRDELRAERH